MNITRINRV